MRRTTECGDSERPWWPSGSVCLFALALLARPMDARAIGVDQDYLDVAGQWNARGWGTLAWSLEARGALVPGYGSALRALVGPGSFKLQWEGGPRTGLYGHIGLRAGERWNLSAEIVVAYKTVGDTEVGWAGGIAIGADVPLGYVGPRVILIGTVDMVNMQDSAITRYTIDLHHESGVIGFMGMQLAIDSPATWTNGLTFGIGYAW